MASSSSSASSGISFESESTREATPEYDPIAAYEACAPLHWDVEEWDFQTWSEDDESLTDGEDLQLLLGGELDEDDEDDTSWEEDFFSSEEEVDSSSRRKTRWQEATVLAAATMTAATMIVMPAWLLRSSAAGSPVPTGGRS
jgi:hypothetical protein